MPASMTGFARHEVQHPWGTISCEVRSVNHRYLEPSLRLPENLRSVEGKIREGLREGLHRGKVEVTLAYKFSEVDNDVFTVNEGLADRVIQTLETLQRRIQGAAPINPVDVLNWPGVIESAEVDSETLQKAALEAFAAALKELKNNRAREGAALVALIEQRLDGIAEQVDAVRERMPTLLKLHHDKLRQKLEALKVDVDEDRFAQEAVYIAQKADIAEELDRLATHLSEVRRVLKQKGAIGRRLDFLMQELNREANTLSSKSVASENTQSAVDIKVFIEQMREQIQNIE